MPALAVILEMVGVWLSRYLMTKAVLWFAGWLARAGLVIGTNEMFVEPLVDYAITAWSMIPNQYLCWFGAFGVTKAISIILSASTLLMGKQIFFSKASS